MLDWRTETFLDVCETRNFTRTAERLNITQPAVSQHIAWLERELGTRLFERRGRSLELTAAGELAKRTLRAQRNEERNLLREIAVMKGSERSLNIGATLTAGEYQLAKPLARWCAQHEHVRVRIEVADTERLLKRLDDGGIDCALVEGVFDASRYRSLPWCEERMLCVEGVNVDASAPDVPPQGGATEAARPLSAGSSSTGPLSFHDLLDRTLIVREPGSGSRAVLEAALGHVNLTVESFARVIEVASVGMACEMAAAGLGITFVYESAARRRIDWGQLRVIDVHEAGLSHPISFVWPRETEFGETCRKLFLELRGMR